MHLSITCKYQKTKILNSTILLYIIFLCFSHAEKVQRNDLRNKSLDLYFLLALNSRTFRNYSNIWKHSFSRILIGETSVNNGCVLHWNTRFLMINPRGAGVLNQKIGSLPPMGGTKITPRQSSSSLILVWPSVTSIQGIKQQMAVYFLSLNVRVCTCTLLRFCFKDNLKLRALSPCLSVTQRKTLKNIDKSKHGT